MSLNVILVQRFRACSLMGAVLLTILTPYVQAQPASDSLLIPIGEPVARLTAASDTTQHYALYLPTSYSEQHPPPVLLLMDPRGRALIPFDLFRDVAERYGYLVMSSYETLSDADSAFVVNERALNAMIRDAQLRFSIDTARLYLVGFSGTAHYAWFVAAGLDGYLAGIIGVGDGLLPYDPSVEAATKMKRPVAYFGIAGSGDFNYDNTWRRDRALDDSPLPHRFAEFEGPHMWPPKPLAETAVEWLELQAVRSGLAERDAAWIHALYAKRLEEARALEEAEQRADAFRLYREITADFEGLVDVEEVQRRAEALARNRKVRGALARRQALAEQVDDYRRTVYAFIDDYRNTAPLISHREAVRRLDIQRLKREADSRDAEQAAAAYRMLASASAQTGFYEPRAYLEQGDYERAAGILRIAQEINPTGFTCYQLAQAEAQLGNEDAALDALACAAEGGGIRPETVRTDPLLAPIRNTPRFEEIVAPYRNDAGRESN